MPSHSDSFTSTHKLRARAAHTGSSACSRKQRRSQHNTGSSSVLEARRWWRRTGVLFFFSPKATSFLPPSNAPSLRKPLYSSCSLSPQHTLNSKSRKFALLAENSVVGAAPLLFPLLPLLLLLLSVDLLLLCSLFFSCLCSESLLLCSPCPLYFYLSSVALPLFLSMSHPPTALPALIGREGEVSTRPPAGASGTVQLLKKEEEMN